MPRRLRVASGGFAYHVLNRAVGRARIFGKNRDYEALEEVLVEAKRRLPMRVLAWCVLPNHWHLTLWPRGDGDLSEFMRWMTVTHTQRWHAAHRTSGTGPLYQGRFKSFPIQEDDHLLRVLRYVERNPLRANLVPRAEEWRWSSLWHRVHGVAGIVDDPPVGLPRNWSGHVNSPETEAELAALRRSVVRGAPYGEDTWQERTAKRLGLQSTLRPARPAVEISSGRNKQRLPTPLNGQVDVDGNVVGNNRPDGQWNLDGQHYNYEIDRTQASSDLHQTVVPLNDADAINEFEMLGE